MSYDNSGDGGLVFLLTVVFVVVMAFGWGIGTLLFPNFSATNARVQHRVICKYLGGEQEGSLCIKDGRAITVDVPSNRNR